MLSMSTELIKADKFALLNDAASEAKEAMQAMRDAGMEMSPRDFLVAKVPTGGGKHFTIGDTVEREIVGALVHFQKCETLWPSFDPVPGTLPILQSYDGIYGERVGPMPQDMAETMEKWRVDGEPYNGRKYMISEASGFPYNQWDTGKEGRGKRMNEQRIVFLLRPDDLAPLIVRYPCTSIGAFDKFIKESMQLTKAPFWRYLVKLQLVETKNKANKVYSEIVTQCLSLIDRQAAIDIQSSWGEAVKTIARRMDEPTTEAA
jgi:hypothetical protein